jgi:hypothetical protein
MDITILAAWGEFIGGIAVVVSLVYLASQIRQNSRLWTSPGIVDTWMAKIELSEGVPWVSNDLPPSSRTKPSAR